MYVEAQNAHVAVATLLKANHEVFVALGQALRQSPPTCIITCARGSSDHAATYAKYLIETRLGIPTASIGLSVASIYDTPMKMQGGLCIAISQSGRSPDLLKTLEACRRGGARIVTLVNDPEAPIIALSDHVILLKAFPEKAIAATKSFIASLAAMAALVAHWADDQDLIGHIDALSAQLIQAFECDWSAAIPDLARARNLYVIGRGLGFAIAQEAALKLKETSGLHAEAFSSAEVRHGPMALVGPGFPILGLASSDATGDGVRTVISEFAARGAPVWLADTHLGGGPEGVGHLQALRTDPVLEPILMIQSFYRLVAHLAIARGFDPDQPPHLNKITQTL